jgi:hypothetical protein
MSLSSFVSFQSRFVTYLLTFPRNMYRIFVKCHIMFYYLLSTFHVLFYDNLRNTRAVHNLTFVVLQRIFFLQAQHNHILVLCAAREIKLMITEVFRKHQWQTSKQIDVFI